jgi:hypothetical protein
MEWKVSFYRMSAFYISLLTMKSAIAFGTVYTGTVYFSSVESSRIFWMRSSGWYRYSYVSSTLCYKRTHHSLDKFVFVIFSSPQRWSKKPVFSRETFGISKILRTVYCSRTVLNKYRVIKTTVHTSVQYSDQIIIVKWRSLNYTSINFKTL